MESSSSERKTERVTLNLKGDSKDNKSSKGDENGAEELINIYCKNAKGEHEVGATKIGAGAKNRGRPVVRAQDDSSSDEQSQAISNGEDSNYRGQFAVMACHSGEGDSEIFKDRKSSKGNENGAEDSSKVYCKKAKGEHDVEATKTRAGAKNKGRSVIKSQEVSSSDEQSQAVSVGEDSNNRGELAVMACQSGEGDSEMFKDSENDVSGEKITSLIQNKSFNDSSKQRKRCKYIVTDNAYYGRDREDTRYSISDSDIAHCNEIIRREVEETIEFGAKLGLVFKKDGQLKAQELMEKNKNINRRKA